jgi:hypothetical protein
MLLWYRRRNTANLQLVTFLAFVLTDDDRLRVTTSENCVLRVHLQRSVRGENCVPGLRLQRSVRGENCVPGVHLQRSVRVKTDRFDANHYHHVGVGPLL